MFSPALIALILAAVAAGVMYVLRSKSIERIRGPPSPSLIFGKYLTWILKYLTYYNLAGVGHEYAFSCQNEVGDLEFEWMRTYGPTWRIRGNFGVRRDIRTRLSLCCPD